MKKVIVAGSRTYTNRKYIHSVLDGYEDITIISGMARGVDLIAYKYALDRDIPCVKIEANWKDMSKPCRVRTNQYGKYNALAGFKRNKAMAKIADEAIVFIKNNSRGSRHMINLMVELKKPVLIIKINNKNRVFQKMYFDGKQHHKLSIHNTLN